MSRSCFYFLELFVLLPSFNLIVNWQKEIEELRNNLANISATSDDGAQKLKNEYLQKLTVLEAQVRISMVGNFLLYGNFPVFIYLFAGCGVEEKTRRSSSTFETKTKE